jgi:hypothetical protein
MTALRTCGLSQSQRWLSLSNAWNLPTDMTLNYMSGRIADASLQRIIPFGQMPRMYQSSPIGSSPWSVPKSPEFATIA